MYTNIPRAETTNIILNILKTNQNINEDNKKINNTHTRHNNGTKLLPIPTKMLQTNRRTDNGSTNIHNTSRKHISKTWNTNKFTRYY
jgi:hypothetical protein